MPNESIEHSLLVEDGANYIRKKYSGITTLSTDDRAHLGSEKLLPYLGCQPDVVCRLSDDSLIIGEAKTEADTLRKHSKLQYLAYLEYLARQSHPGILIVFCSWKRAVSLEDYLRGLAAKMPPSDVQWCVVSDAEMAKI